MTPSPDEQAQSINPEVSTLNLQEEQPSFQEQEVRKVNQAFVKELKLALETESSRSIGHGH